MRKALFFLVKANCVFAILVDKLDNLESNQTIEPN